MIRIDDRTVELDENEQRLSADYEAQLDAGLGCGDAIVEAWRAGSNYGWAPERDFVAWLLGLDPENMDYAELIDEACYAFHCLMVTCPDHGPVMFVEADSFPSMAGGTDSSETWSCGCTVGTTPFGSSRRRPDGTYSDDCGQP